ncbi:hypothetical protein HPB52_020852 [Rhipicephalus sanguineus]|uniref:Uncharacterized protein n=1 Tax=Rhipicephalus sanguineus TaxID=34632 RepID=A0A9D4PYQ1_RHISA|nr:hypothetical protein HPB52_020852 [Rhipicephalus sanguineus]
MVGRVTLAMVMPAPIIARAVCALDWVIVAGNVVAASYRTSTRYLFVSAIPGSYYFLRPDRNVRPACGRGSRLIIFLELSSSPPLRGPQRRRRLLSRSSATRLCVGNQTLTGVDPFPPSVG